MDSQVLSHVQMHRNSTACQGNTESCKTLLFMVVLHSQSFKSQHQCLLGSRGQVAEHNTSNSSKLCSVLCDMFGYSNANGEI